MHPINMRPIPQHDKLILAEEQEDFVPLPCLLAKDRQYVITEWAFTKEDLKILKDGGRIRIQTLIMGQPFQPVLISVIDKTEVLDLELAS